MQCILLYSHFTWPISWVYQVKNINFSLFLTESLNNFDTTTEVCGQNADPKSINGTDGLLASLYTDTPLLSENIGREFLRGGGVCTQATTSLRKQRTFCDAATINFLCEMASEERAEILYWWCVTTQGSASDWLKLFNALPRGKIISQEHYTCYS